MKILVVEDNYDYRQALIEMYQQIFDKIAVQIDHAVTGKEAIEMLKKNKYDLLSLDINLSENLHKNEQGKLRDIDITGACGMDVLDVAGKRKSCTGVVVITLLENDPNLDLIIPDKQKQNRLQMTIDSNLRKYFSNTSLRLSKRPIDKVSISEQIVIFKEELTLDQIRSLCDVRYAITIGSNQFPYQITINSQNTGQQIYIQEEDVELLYRLTQRKRGNKDPRYVTKEEVVECYQHCNPRTLQATRLIENCCRRLQKSGIDTRKLIDSPTAQVPGWRLTAETNAWG